MLIIDRYAEKIFATYNFTSMKALDFVKLVCKDFWVEVFKKKVSLLSTLPDGESDDNFLKRILFFDTRLTGYTQITKGYLSCQTFISSGSIATH